MAQTFKRLFQRLRNHDIGYRFVCLGRNHKTYGSVAAFAPEVALILHPAKLPPWSNHPACQTLPLPEHSGNVACEVCSAFGDVWDSSGWEVYALVEPQCM